MLYTPISQNCGDAVSGVTSIDVSDPENIVIRVWRSTPEYGAGVWGRAGVAIGKDGGIYAGTGDAPYNPGLRIFGNTMFRLDPDTLKLVDYYTPTNWEYVWKRDFDITASALVLDYKGRELVVIGGKEGVLYLMDAEDMGGLTHHDNLYTTPLLSNDDEWFEAKGLWGGFSSYVDSQGRVWVYAPTWGPVSVQAPKFPHHERAEPERFRDGVHRSRPSRHRQPVPQARVGQQRLGRARAGGNRERCCVRAVQRRERAAIDQRGHHAVRGIQFRRAVEGFPADRARR